MPTAVLRRYTPPTCTLEVAANGSALSRWADRPVLTDLRFQLSFDDPKLPPDRQVTVEGNGSQLEELREAVNQYVQTLLGQTLSPVSNGVAEAKATAPHTASAVRPALQRNGTDLAPASVYLQPEGWLNHHLCLGHLASDESGAFIPLSTLQLFDLANALDEYHAEALTLPTVGRSHWLKQPGQWGKVAAVLVLAAGATGAIVKFIADVSTPAINTASADRTGSLSDQSLASRRISEPSAPLPPTAPLKLEVPAAPPAGMTKAPDPSPSASPQAKTMPNPETKPSSPQFSTLPPTQILTVPPQSSFPGTGNAPAGAPYTTAIPQAGVAAAPGAAPPQGAAAPSIASDAASDANAFSRMAPENYSIDASRVNSGAGANGVNSAEGNSQVATSSTAFDTIPQVAEVRNYFQKRWQPPQGLTQTLQYSLVLNPDGSVQRIVPLGAASEVYVDRTGMPLMGESFVSAVEGTSNPRIRVVLLPDGKVQTFLESK